MNSLQLHTAQDMINTLFYTPDELAELELEKKLQNQNNKKDSQKPKVIYNNKILDAMSIALTARLLVLEGTARSSKTMIFSDVIYYAVINSSEKYHVIAARDLDAINNNILYADVVGLMNLHPDCILKKGKIGGYYVSMTGIDGEEKVINLVNYSNESSWKKILGGTKGVIYIDEVNIASKNFVDECFVRQTSASNPHTYFTLNGDDPAHWCYQDYINYCVMLGKVPVSILNEMKEFQNKRGVKKGWLYMHFTMWDNPIMTPAKIQDAMNIFAPGSYYYTTKILGERGIQGDLLFMDYMDESLIVDAFEKDKNGNSVYDLRHFAFGADVGANRAYNSIHFIGFERGFKRAIILFEKVFATTGYDKKKPIIFDFIKFCLTTLKIHPSQVDGFLLDCAEQNFIADLNDQVYYQFGIDVVGSWKATIKDRIDLMSIGFSLKRILFHTACRATYQAYFHAQKGKENYTRLDTDETNAKGDNDRMDSCEYGLTRHMKDLMAFGGDY